MIANWASLGLFDTLQENMPDVFIIFWHFKDVRIHHLIKKIIVLENGIFLNLYPVDYVSPCPTVHWNDYFIQQLHQAGVVQKSSTGSTPSAVKELHETKTIRDNVDREIRSLPSQTLQDAVSSLQTQKEGNVWAVSQGEGTGRRAGKWRNKIWTMVK